MKKSLYRMLVLAAAAVAVSAAAYADDVLVANIPFSFQMGGTELAAGKYKVGSPNRGANQVIHLRNEVTGQAQMLLPQNVGQDVRSGKARLIFRCGEESGCSIASIWTGNGYGWEFRTPKLRPDERERLAVVFLNRNQAE